MSLSLFTNMSFANSTVNISNQQNVNINQDAEVNNLVNQMLNEISLLTPLFLNQNANGNLRISEINHGTTTAFVHVTDNTQTVIFGISKKSCKIISVQVRSKVKDTTVMQIPTPISQLKQQTSQDTNMRLDMIETQGDNPWCLSYVVAQVLRANYGKVVKAQDIASYFARIANLSLRDVAPQIEHQNQYLQTQMGGVMKIASGNVSNYDDVIKYMNNYGYVMLSGAQSASATTEHMVLVSGYSRSTNNLITWNPHHDYYIIVPVQLGSPVEIGGYSINYAYYNDPSLTFSNDQLSFVDKSTLLSAKAQAKLLGDDGILGNNLVQVNPNSNNPVKTVDYGIPIEPYVQQKTLPTNNIQPVNNTQMLANNQLNNIQPISNNLPNFQLQGAGTTYNFGQQPVNYSVYSRTSSNPNAKNFNMNTKFSNAIGKPSSSGTTSYSNTQNTGNSKVTISYN